jgi:division protein CdvB (Snf7/Vps24/ESCRT-III family)
MVKNMKQVNKMLENVNKDMNAAELAKVMEKFEQVRISLFCCTEN